MEKSSRIGRDSTLWPEKSKFSQNLLKITKRTKATETGGELGTFGTRNYVIGIWSKKVPGRWRTRFGNFEVKSSKKELLELLASKQKEPIFATQHTKSSKKELFWPKGTWNLRTQILTKSSMFPPLCTKRPESTARTAASGRIWGGIFVAWKNRQKRSTSGFWPKIGPSDRPDPAITYYKCLSGFFIYITESTKR